VDLLRQYSTHPDEDVQIFLDVIAFNWLIAGTDGHAKNYALLLGGQGAVRLAPFYDLASVLPYQRITHNKAKLAMGIGGEYRLSNIGLRHWHCLAADVRTDPNSLVARITAMAAASPDLVATIQKEVEAEGLTHRTISVLAQRLKSRVKLCQVRLQAKAGRG
jgi:serine/threonine-protein kinase HipA